MKQHIEKLPYLCIRVRMYVYDKFRFIIVRNCRRYIKYDNSVIPKTNHCNMSEFVIEKGNSIHV